MRPGEPTIVLPLAAGEAYGLVAVTLGTLLAVTGDARRDDGRPPAVECATATSDDSSHGRDDPSHGPSLPRRKNPVASEGPASSFTVPSTWMNSALVQARVPPTVTAPVAASKPPVSSIDIRDGGRRRRLGERDPENAAVAGSVSLVVERDHVVRGTGKGGGHALGPRASAVRLPGAPVAT